MKLNNSDYEFIERTIINDFNAYYQKYDFKKYSAEDYQKFKNDFSKLNTKNNSIEDALKWKWGHANKLNYPKKQQELVDEIKLYWSSFVQEQPQSSEETFEYWKKNLQKNTRYITVAYITHLVHYNEIPIIDQHNFRAMNHLILKRYPNYTFKKKPTNWNDLINLKIFIDEISKRTNKSKEDLDKYLMMFGKSIK
jgi:hypothetical protein